MQTPQSSQITRAGNDISSDISIFPVNYSRIYDIASKTFFTNHDITWHQMITYLEKSIECGNQYQNVIVCGCIWFYPNFLEDYLVYICRSKSKFIHTIKKTIESLSPRFATKYNKLSKDHISYITNKLAPRWFGFMIVRQWTRQVITS